MKKRILIVEDEEKLRRVLELQLMSAGFEVDKAASAEEGLKLVDRAAMGRDVARDRATTVDCFGVEARTRRSDELADLVAGCGMRARMHSCPAREENHRQIHGNDESSKRGDERPPAKTLSDGS